MGNHHLCKFDLISLGALEDIGCKFQSEDGVLKVSKGSLTLMKVDRVCTLYFLQGSTITGSATIASSTSDSDNTKLWHMRLGHMSERGMMILSKRGLLYSQSTGKLDILRGLCVWQAKETQFSTIIYNMKGILDYIHLYL